MNILDIAIETAGGVSKLAVALGVEQNVVSNWRYRKILPDPWAQVLAFKYAKAIKAAKNVPQTT